MTAKIVNYTPEQTTFVVSGYTKGDSVEFLATTMGKSVRSIIAKLSREGVYTKPTYTTKTGEVSIKKDTHADAIGSMLGLSESETESLCKANKSVLVKVFTALSAK